jgi:hypothetical protein
MLRRFEVAQQINDELCVRASSTESRICSKQDTHVWQVLGVCVSACVVWGTEMKGSTYHDLNNLDFCREIVCKAPNSHSTVHK